MPVSGPRYRDRQTMKMTVTVDLKLSRQEKLIPLVYMTHISKQSGMLIEQESRESSRRSGTASGPRTLCISRLILILWILLVSFSVCSLAGRPVMLILNRRPRNWNTRDRRLDDPRTAHYCPRPGRNQPHRCRHCRGLSGVRYEC